VAQVEGGYSSGDWGGPAAWGCSVYYPVVTNAGWGLGDWGYDVWGLGNGGLVSASDTVAYLPAYEVSVAETVTVADTVITTNQNIAVSIIETVNADDSSSGAVALPLMGTVSETANIVDETSATITTLVVSYIDETANIVDTTSTSATFVVTAQETVNAVDILSTLGIFVVAASETSTATDQVLPNGVYGIGVNETARAQDVVNRRLLWEPIDTDVNGNWTLINTNQ
jgi:hypothetical protein